MSSNIRRYRRWILLAALLWLGLMAVVWWQAKRTVAPAWFDPAQIAPHAFNDPANIARLLAALEEEQPSLKKGGALFIRFAQPDCPCEQLVENYHLLLTPSLQKQGLRVINLDSDAMQHLAARLGPELWEWVPSTPAILVLDARRSLAYFGPYHQEGICSSENSYLEPVLEALRQGRPVNIVNTLVEGCFCPFPTDLPGVAE